MERTPQTARKPRSRNAGLESSANQDLHPSYLLWQVSHHSFHILDEVLAPLELRARPFAFLRLLREHGSISQQELASIAGVDPSTVVVIMDSMERAGLAERRRNPKDRRAYRLYLTPQGETMLAQAEQHLTQYEERLLRPLSDRERKTLVRLLTKVLEAR